MTIYPLVLAAVAKACSDYRAKVVGIEELQSVLWNAAEQILSLEEKELRRFLQNAESQLELLRFTVDTELVFERSLAVVTEIEKQLAEWSSPP